MKFKEKKKMIKNATFTSVEEKKMKILGISGKARNGKDTAADIIKTKLEELGYSVLKASYGDLVKYVCKTFFNWNGEKDEKGRTLLQYVGTDIIRNQVPDYWVDFIADMLDFFKSEWDYVLIPDCRFPNEIERMKERGFDVYSMRVIRDGFKSDLTEEQLKHISETALDDYTFDFVVHNDKGLEDLREMLIPEVVDKILM